MTRIILSAFVCALLLVSCGGEVREYQVRSTTVSEHRGNIFWTIDVAVYSPASRKLEGKLLVGKQEIRSKNQGFSVPISFSSSPPTARFRFLVPRENMPQARLEITDGNKKTLLPVG